MNNVLLERVPEKIKKIVGPSSGICLLSGRDVFTALKDEKVIVMGCNPRIKHAIPGIMKAAEELDAVVAFELTKNEGGIDGGYTGLTPHLFSATVFEYAEHFKFTKPFLLHADHVTVKNDSPEEFSAASDLVKAQIDAGYTSFAFDASFNPLRKNIDIVVRLAKQLPDSNYGLEVELGETGNYDTAALTSVDEAEEFLRALQKAGIFPQLLAISNGSKRGNYLDGEVVRIDLTRTQEVYNVAVAHGLSGLVQHGITGTPLHLVGRLAEFGVRKGNIGTLWQNVSHAGLPLELMDEMRLWAKKNKKDIKYATGFFRDQIDAIPEKNAKLIHEMAYREAREFLTAFNAKGSATKLGNALTEKR